MKELFDRHQPRMTPEEDQKVWGRIEKNLARPRSFLRTWRIPAGVTAAAGAAVAVVLLIRQPAHHETGIAMSPQTPIDRTETMPSQDRAAPAQPERFGKMEAKGPRAMPPQSQVAAEDAMASARGRDAQDASPRTPASLGTVTGRVTDERGKPLVFASVLIPGTALGGMSDSTGSFVIDNVPPGRHPLKVSYLGYEAEEVPVNVPAGSILAQNFELSESSMAEMQPSQGNADRYFGLPETFALAEPKSDMVRREKSATVPSAPSEKSAELPADSFQEAVGLKSKVVTRGRPGVVTQGDELHIRGGREGEVRSQLNGVSGAETPAPTLSPAPRKDESGWPVSVGGTDPVNGQSFDAMFFEHYGVNPFLDPEDDRFSTFAVDVDNASYTLARSYLQRGALPPKEAVRVEEFVNAFRHHYAPPRDPLVADRRWAPSEQGTFAIHLEAAPSPFGPGLVLFRVGLKGKEISAAERKPAVLTFVVDVSGSMERENRLELVKRALFLLLDQMNRRDRVALVVYGSDARVLLPHTSLAERQVIEDAINRLRPEGSTNAEAGLREGYALADRSFERGEINRVILCSDGVANVGTTDAEGILGIVKREAGRGIYLTTVGFGMGNYNDVLMEKLADQGDGNYYYVDELAEARRVFVENLTGTLQTIARDAKIQVEFDPGQVRRYRLLGYENRDVADRDFRNDAVDAGEVGAGHEVTALFEMKLDRNARRGPVATVRIRYEDPETHRVTEEVRTLRSEDLRSRLESTDPSFRLDAAAAEFAEILRHSYWAKDGDLARVHGLAREAARSIEDADPARELVGLIETARRLWPEAGPTQWRDDVRPSWEPDDDDR